MSEIFGCQWCEQCPQTEEARDCCASEMITCPIDYPCRVRDRIRTLEKELKELKVIACGGVE
jgi:hypothetical protein